MTYGREALRRLREQQANPQPAQQPSLLDQIPADAPMDDATLCVWNGERFVAYDKWLATAPVLREEAAQEDGLAISADATCVAGQCSQTKVWLVRDGDRWLMYVGSQTAGGRRRDFASPFVAHAIRTAEHWYGPSEGGWRAERRRDGGATGTDKAADLPPQGSTAEERLGTGGHDDLGLDGVQSGW